MTEPQQRKQYITKSTLKREFKLTDSLIKLLGEPDAARSNPHYKSGPPMQLYLRERIVQWVAEHHDLIESTASRRKAAQKAVETKRLSAREEIAALVRKLRMRPIPERARLEQAVRYFLADRYEDYDGEVTEKALCSYIRHNYTNYEEILEQVKGKVGAAELYENVKVYLCCRIIQKYQLDVDPLYDAFGEAIDFFGLPQRFKGYKDNIAGLEARVAQLIGIQDKDATTFPESTEKADTDSS